MREVNPLVIVVSVVIELVLGVAIGIAASLIYNDSYILQKGVAIGFFFAVLLAAPAILVFGAVFNKIAQKTMKKLDTMDFCTDGTFYSNHATLKLDVINGKIAYVSSLNPFELQVVSAAKLEDIGSSYIKGPLGGTRYVYFQFAYNNIRTKIPTFTSRQMYSLNSSEVMTAISKADAYAGYLKQAKENAMHA